LSKMFTLTSLNVDMLEVEKLFMTHKESK